MWAERGSWAVRYVPGAAYARDSCGVSSTWDWAAQSLGLKPPALFGGYFGAVHKERPATPAPNSQGDSEGIPKPALLRPSAVPLLRDKILRRRRHAPTQSSSSETMSNRTPPQNHPIVSQPRRGHRGEETPNQAQVGQATDAAHANFPEFTTSCWPNSPSHAPRTTPPEADARERALRTHSEFRPASSYRGTSRAPSNRPTQRSLSSLRNQVAPCAPAPPVTCFSFCSDYFHEWSSDHGFPLTGLRASQWGEPGKGLCVLRRPSTL